MSRVQLDGFSDLESQVRVLDTIFGKQTYPPLLEKENFWTWITVDVIVAVCEMI